MTNVNDDNFFTIHTIAELCGVTDRTVERWYADGKLPVPYRVIKGTKCWTPAQAREILAENRKSAVEGRIT